MLDPLTTIVWSSTVSYSFPIRKATIAGNVVTVTQLSHNLTTSDLVVVAGSGDNTVLSATSAVSVIDKNRFSYFLSSSPVHPGVEIQPGQKVNIWLSCARYSALLNYPARIRFSVALANEVAIEVFENDTWIQKLVVTNTEGLTDVFFDARWKNVRLKQTVGATVPTVTAYHASSPEPIAAALTTFHIPTDVDGGGLTPVGIPGTYDVVTTNAYGQVVSGVTGGGADNNIYSSMMNNGLSNIPKGAPVRKTGPTTIELAQGNTAKKGVIGIAAEPILIGQTKIVLVEGTLTMPTGDWDLITGGSGGLVNDDVPYFLSFSVAGQLTKTVNIDTAPAGSYLVAVGYAIDANQLKIDIDAPIKVS